MTGTLALVPLLIVLVTATVTLAVGRWPRVQRGLSVAGTVGYAAVVAVLVRRVVFDGDGGAVAHQVGGWPAPVGITVVADALAVFMLALVAVVGLYAVVFSVQFVDEVNQRVYYHPLVQFLLLGATGAVLTGDLFNLFVWFEVMLIASYAFVAFYGGAQHTAAAMRYVVLNIVGSVFMLLGIGGLYATVGTLNMADLAMRVGDPGPGVALTPVVGLLGLLLVTFALKAGVVPFQFWVPAAYSAAPLPVTAILAGVSKKVGIYAIIRLYFTVFGGAEVTGDVPGIATEVAPLAFLAPVLLVMGLASVVIGGLGAVTQDTLDGLFAYSSIGQVGFIVVPVALAAGTTAGSLRHLGILAALVYTLHHALTKSTLFLVAGAVQDGTGTTTISELGGLARRSPVFAGAFLVAGLSLVGIPPLAGFFGKLFVFDAAATAFARVSTVGAAAVLVVLLAGAVLTIVYTTRAWVACCWGDRSQPVATGDVARSQAVVLALMTLVIVAVGAGFEPVYLFADAAAEAALDGEAYVELVGPGGEGS